MIIVTIRSRLRPDVGDEYSQLAEEMSAIVTKMPGYLSHKGFDASDGEHVTLALFESEEALREWSRHPEHLRAKRIGRERFYTRYHVQISKLVRESRFELPAPASS
jgi:heme-degrading monooxygenase HmoA